MQMMEMKNVEYDDDIQLEELDNLMRTLHHIGEGNSSVRQIDMNDIKLEISGNGDD
jgi:hypothetical protein